MHTRRRIRRRTLFVMSNGKKMDIVRSRLAVADIITYESKRDNNETAVVTYLRIRHIRRIRRIRRIHDHSHHSHHIRRSRRSYRNLKTKWNRIEENVDIVKTKARAGCTDIIKKTVQQQKSLTSVSTVSTVPTVSATIATIAATVAAVATVT